MASQRQFFVGGNFKMNGNISSIKEIVKRLNDVSWFEAACVLLRM